MLVARAKNDFSKKIGGNIHVIFQKDINHNITDIKKNMSTGVKSYFIQGYTNMNIDASVAFNEDEVREYFDIEEILF